MAAIKLQPAIYPAHTSFAKEVPASSPLSFRKITIEDLPAINEIVRTSGSFTCDYTIGGIFMWVDYFDYEFCIYEDTLFISGKSENHLDRRAFSCPIGKLPLPKAIAVLQDYCTQNNIELNFSAIPADKMTCFTAFNPDCRVEELEDWGDYVYEAESFATLSGKKMAKKRNHVNRFKSDFPNYTVETITPSNADELKQSMIKWHTNNEYASTTEDEELRQVCQILDHPESYPFTGIALRKEAGGEIVAFSLAEVINNTAFVHIEKMNHEIAGAGETVAHLLVNKLIEENPEIKYINREEDCGDPGLRRAKESWQPAMILRKYNVSI